jgi:hypothetical protein
MRTPFSACLGLSRTRSLTYDADAVPAGGAAVVASPAAPVPRAGLDPAGAAFHEVAMKQAGVFGEAGGGGGGRRGRDCPLRLLPQPSRVFFFFFFRFDRGPSATRG